MAAPSKKPVFYLLLFSALILLLILIMQPVQVIRFKEYISVIFPKGLIGLEERNLLLIIQGLMLLVIVPVYLLTFAFSWRYRAGNTKAVYDPDLVDNTLAEYVWWGVPCVITLIIAILTWQKTHQLDPFRPIESDKKPVVIQVVALQWKWLFIYPEEKVASVNFLQIPEKTPIKFEITADAPMNSFWIPSLGGQIYAMPKMKTELNLIADQPGDFRGSSANISGEGFAGMYFTTRAGSEENYREWITNAQKSEKSLDSTTYKELALPSEYNQPETYKLGEPELFHAILMKYMHPQEKI